MRRRGLVRCTGRAVVRFPACTHDAMPACVHARQRTARHGPFASIEMTGIDPLADRIAEIVVGCLRGEVPRTVSTGLRGHDRDNLDLTHKARGGVSLLEESRERRVSDAMPRELLAVPAAVMLLSFAFLQTSRPNMHVIGLVTCPAGFSLPGRFFRTLSRPFRFPGIWLAPRYRTALISAQDPQDGLACRRRWRQDTAASAGNGLNPAYCVRLCSACRGWRDVPRP